MARAKHKNLTFSGKEEDFMTFMEQFEAKMYMLKLDRALRDKITTPAIKPEELAEGTQAREDAEASRDDMRCQVWWELVLCLVNLIHPITQTERCCSVEGSGTTVPEFGEASDTKDDDAIDGHQDGVEGGGDGLPDPSRGNAYGSP